MSIATAYTSPVASSAKWTQLAAGPGSLMRTDFAAPVTGSNVRACTRWVT